MLLSDLEAYVRQDLFDPSGTNQRWQLSDIDRAIDKAVDKYTVVYPNVAFVDMQSQPYQRTYPYPTSWNTLYPVQWIERILYPLQTWGSYFLPPVAGMTAAKTTGTGKSIGVYQYGVTFLSQGGETPISPLVSVTTTTGNQNVNLAAIPLGPSTPVQPAAATNYVIGRNIYVSLVGATTMYYLATIADNTTTTYADSAADTSLNTALTPPTVNTSGVMTWPPRDVDFSEFSNLYDSNASLAAGGNSGAMGAVGGDTPQYGIESANTPTFTLKLNSSQLPNDNTMVLRVFYATKHQLDNTGSTIPEIHRDIIVLGAVAYAMEAYQIPTNDNFDFQDGALRDKIDDTKIPTAWIAAAKNKMTQFEARLTEIKQQRDFATSARANWGQIPSRYNWL